MEAAALERLAQAIEENNNLLRAFLNQHSAGSIEALPFKPNAKSSSKAKTVAHLTKHLGPVFARFVTQ